MERAAPCSWTLPLPCTGRLEPWDTRPQHHVGYLVGGEGPHMCQQGLAELWALVEDGPQLLRRQLQDDLEALGLGALAALDEAFPHLGVLPHLHRTRRGHAGHTSYLWGRHSPRPPSEDLGFPALAAGASCGPPRTCSGVTGFESQLCFPVSLVLCTPHVLAQCLGLHLRPH